MARNDDGPSTGDETLDELTRILEVGLRQLTERMLYGTSVSPVEATPATDTAPTPTPTSAIPLQPACRMCYVRTDLLTMSVMCDESHLPVLDL